MAKTGRYSALHETGSDTVQGLLSDACFVPIADTKRQKPQPCSRGFACYGGVRANQNNTPARQLDSAPAVAISLRGADRLGVPIN